MKNGGAISVGARRIEMVVNIALVIVALVFLGT